MSILLRSLLNLTKCKLDTVTLFFNKSEITFQYVVNATEHVDTWNMFRSIYKET